ncbi:hypothetical protein DENSPDRAFT_836847 [Dentipellis sp. KUC8613]|nr:hypothetical protein DENSPDRAFT_836847 [Dentipellis sp. KUC8613]
MLSACVIALLFASVAPRAFGATTPLDSMYRARRALETRQGFDPTTIPASCQSTCTAPIVTINTCVTLACDCNKQVMGPLVQCVDCVVSLSPTPSHQEEGQAYLDEVETVCLGGGFNVGPLNVVVSNVAAPSGSAASAAANSTINIPVFSAPASTGAAVVPTAPAPAPSSSSSSNGNGGNSGNDGPLGGAGAAGGKSASISVHSSCGSVVGAGLVAGMVALWIL